MLTVDKVVRGFTANMAPHLHHQDKWRPIEGGLYCEDCSQTITSAKMFAAASMLTPSQRDRAKEAISRWIRTKSPDSAKLIFRM